MKLTIKLNIEEFQNIDFESNEYDNISNCYSEVSDFLGGWIDYAPKAVKLKEHINHIIMSTPIKEGEKSVIVTEKGVGSHSMRNAVEIDSKPSFISTPSLARREAQLEKTTVVETQNFVDVRECEDYSEKSYKLIGYDMKSCFLAKSLVIRTEQLKEGGTRVLVNSDKAWVISKLEWQ